MGLTIEVGYLRDMKENDEEGVQWFNEEMEKINGILRQLKLPEHKESDKADIWSFDMFGYSGLHYLRRIAAHIDNSGALPSPGDADSSKDNILEMYFEDYLQPEKKSLFSLFSKSKKRKGAFDHLIIHSDADGYYLPVDFQEVIIPPENLKIPGGMIGSSVQLIKELEKIANVLELPEDLDPEDEEVWEAADAQGESNIKWKKYGVESYTCLGLLKASRLSIRNNTAIVFC
jgi:hypothetical protein